MNKFHTSYLKKPDMVAIKIVFKRGQKENDSIVLCIVCTCCPWQCWLELKRLFQILTTGCLTFLACIHRVLYDMSQPATQCLASPTSSILPWRFLRGRFMWNKKCHPLFFVFVREKETREKECAYMLKAFMHVFLVPQILYVSKYWQGNKKTVYKNNNILFHITISKANDYHIFSRLFMNSLCELLYLGLILHVAVLPYSPCRKIRRYIQNICNNNYIKTKLYLLHCRPRSWSQIGTILFIFI